MIMQWDKQHLRYGIYKPSTRATPLQWGLGRTGKDQAVWRVSAMSVMWGENYRSNLMNEEEIAKKGFVLNVLCYCEWLC